MMTRLMAARAAALSRVRRITADDDRGFVLIYVLMVISIVTVLVTTVLVVAAASVVPSVQGAYDQAAEAAAQGGVQAFLSTLESKCATSAYATISTCGAVLPTNSGSVPPIYVSGGYQSTYSWTVAQTSDGNFRVTSTGTVTNGGVHAQRKLIADISGTSTSPFDYSSATQYETQAPDVMALQYPARTITLGSAAAAYADKLTGSGATSATWNGPSTASAPGSVNSCNNVYYGSTGREFNPVPNVSSPYVDWTEAGSARGQSVADPQPCQVSLGSSTKLIAPANSGSAGAYCTNDALLLSNSDPGSAGGPLLDAPVNTLYSGTADPGGVAGRNYRSFDLAGYNLAVGGNPAAASTHSPTTVTSCPGPIASSPVVPAGSCVYKGPTRVWLNGDTAVVTSPETTAAISGSPSGCYPASLAGGIYAFTITSLAGLTGFSGVFSVTNSGTAPSTLPTAHTSTGWNAVDSTTAVSPTNSVFSKTGAAPSAIPGTIDAEANDPGCTAVASYTVPVTSRVATTCDWSGVTGNDGQGWTAFSAGNCTAALLSTASASDRRGFECAYSGQKTSGAPTNTYATLRSCAKADLGSTTTSATTCLSGAQHTCNATTAPANASTGTNGDLACVLNWELSRANTGTHQPNFATPAKNDVQYIVTAATTLAGLAGGTNTTTAQNPFGLDPLFSAAGGGTSSTSQTYTTTTFTIGRQVYGCYGLDLGVLGCVDPSNHNNILGLQWGNGTTGSVSGGGGSIAQYKVSVTQSTWSTPTCGGCAITGSFPAGSDVSVYGMGPTGSTSTTGPGDLYVEGTTSKSLSLVAANDVIITGALVPTNSSSTGVEIVGQDNVRVYHPVTCVAGVSVNASRVYCNNDLTGLYNTIPANTFRPYQQYTNLRGDLGNLSINAAIFALGNATSTVTCPKWNGAGTCGGEFTADNYNRGTSLSALNLTGGLIQVHHGALGEEWEVLDTNGQTRPQTGYSLTLTYQNIKTLIGNANVLQNVATSSAVWHIISTSTGS